MICIIINLLLLCEGLIFPNELPFYGKQELTHLLISVCYPKNNLLVIAIYHIIISSYPYSIL